MEKHPVKQYSEEQHADINMLVYIADACNYSCPYCYNKKPRTGKMLDLGKLHAFLADAQRKTKKRIAVELIGGEPMLHPGLDSFIAEASSIPDLQLAILTNFSMDLQRYLDFVVKHHVRIIPTWHSTQADPANKSFIDKLMRIPDELFDYVADGKHWHNFFIRVMFEKERFKEAEDVYLKVAERWPAYLEPSLVADPETAEAPSVKDIKIDSKYVYTPEQLARYYKLSDMVKPWKQLYTIEWSDGSVDKLSYNDMFLNDDFTFHMWKCNAGKDYLYIHVDGDIYPCQSYYESCRKKLYNMCSFPVYDASKMKPTICQCKTCSCDFEIYKEKIFKSMPWKQKYQ